MAIPKTIKDARKMGAKAYRCGVPFRSWMHPEWRIGWKMAKAMSATAPPPELPSVIDIERMRDMRRGGGRR